ncbi:MAG: F0F1 ATP synthase subunit gamma [Alphaproteobacteria bacterium]|nr:F0F1 ATP synthase subunit gamma [Alphaproteobacteria bacterium]
MPSLKDLRGRISSVKNTRQITKTMKMVSAAKVVRARQACEEARPYAEKMASVLNGLATNLAGNSSAPLLLRGHDTVRTVRIVVFGSQRGLCGGFNAGLAKQAVELGASLKKQGITVQYVTVGRKVRDQIRAVYPDNIFASHNDLISKQPEYHEAEAFASTLVDAFEKGECEEVVIMYNTFVSMMSQVPTPMQLLPFKAEDMGETATSASVEYEPSEDKILSDLVPRNVAMQVFRGMLETTASEHASRMTAMDSATRNAGDMINRLTLNYNRTRQAMITTEMIEIVSGAEAVK